jgi:hypothetical protein
MSLEKSSFLWFLTAFRDKDQLFETLSGTEYTARQTWGLYVFVVVASALYGGIMGSYHGALQAAATAIKVPFLLTITLLVCFPALFMIQVMLGSKLGLQQLLSVILVGLAFMTAVMLSFVPIVVVFLLTGGSYYFLHLLHISIVVFAGVFGTKLVVDALKFSCEKKSVYPELGVTIFRIWIVVAAFVGIQIAWNLQPFMGDFGKPFKLIRPHEGNFYTAVIYAVRQLGGPTTTPSLEAAAPAAVLDTMLKPLP